MLNRPSKNPLSVIRSLFFNKAVETKTMTEMKEINKIKPADPIHATSVLDQILPAEIMVDVFHYLSKKDLLSASRVSKNWNRLASDEMLWKNHLELGKDDGRSGRLQYLYKKGLIQQKAKLLAQIFKEGPPGYHHEVLSMGIPSLGYYYTTTPRSDLIDLEMIALKKKIFNDAGLHPLAIIREAEKSYQWTPRSTFKEGIYPYTLFNVLVESSLSEVLAVYLKNYKDHIDLDHAFLGRQNTAYMNTPFYAALNPNNASKKPQVKNAILLLQHGAQIAEKEIHIRDHLWQLQQSHQVGEINDEWRQLFCLMIEKGIRKEVVMEIFSDEYRKNRALYDEASTKKTVSPA